MILIKDNDVGICCEKHNYLIIYFVFIHIQDKMQKAIEDAVRNDGSVQQMRSKKTVILLLINPLLNNEKVSTDNKNETGSSSS